VFRRQCFIDEGKEVFILRAGEEVQHSAIIVAIIVVVIIIVVVVAVVAAVVTEADMQPGGDLFTLLIIVVFVKRGLLALIRESWAITGPEGVACLWYIFSVRRRAACEVAVEPMMLSVMVWSDRSNRLLMEKSQRMFSFSSGNIGTGGDGGRQNGERGGGLGEAEEEELLSAMDGDWSFFACG